MPLRNIEQSFRPKSWVWLWGWNPKSGCGSGAEALRKIVKIISNQHVLVILYHSPPPPAQKSAKSWAAHPRKNPGTPENSMRITVWRLIHKILAKIKWAYFVKSSLTSSMYWWKQWDAKIHFLHTYLYSKCYIYYASSRTRTPNVCNLKTFPKTQRDLWPLKKKAMWLHSIFRAI